MTPEEQPITRKVPIQIGFASCIGIVRSRGYPLGWANYFDLVVGTSVGNSHEEQTARGKLEDILKHSVRVLNMWAENLEEAQQRFLPDGLVEIRQYGAHCIIVDERIPKDWRYDKLCFTGCARPSLEVVRDIYALLGDPTNELEQFTNPRHYYESRGWSYNDNGTISKRFGSELGNKEIAR